MTPAQSSFPSPKGEKLAKRWKLCRKCDEMKELSDFARDRSKASGRKSICKLCDREKARRYYATNREAVLARVRASLGPRTPLANRRITRKGVR